MRLHLIKLAVGPSSLKDLQDWQINHAEALTHVTRNFPKRANEILNGGSIYWVIKGAIVARNSIIELRRIIYGDQPHCEIVYSPKLVRVIPRQRRPFQGWRYLEDADIPTDIDENMNDIPEEIIKALNELGVR